jgi:hypothetical protein
LSIKVTPKVLHTEERFLFEGMMALFKLWRPLAGIIELAITEASGNRVLQTERRSVHTSLEIGPEGQLFIPT